MTFVKGESGNPEGRKTGAKNQVTQETRKLFQVMMEVEMPHLQKAMKELREKDTVLYIRALTGLMPYFLPKTTEIEMKIDTVANPPSWFGLDADDAEEVE